MKIKLAKSFIEKLAKFLLDENKVAQKNVCFYRVGYLAKIHWLAICHYILNVVFQ